jgi:hypothetical protein
MLSIAQPVSMSAVSGVDESRLMISPVCADVALLVKCVNFVHFAIMGCLLSAPCDCTAKCTHGGGGEQGRTAVKAAATIS